MCIFFCSFDLLKCIFSSVPFTLDVSHKSILSTLENTENIKQLEGQVQELENLVSSLQQQLKETEENHKAEIHSLQERLQAVNESTVQPRYPSTYNLFKILFNVICGLVTIIVQLF